jgi:hypothetical protein
MSFETMILVILAVASLAFLGGFTLISIREGETRAAWGAGLLTVLFTGIFSLSTLLAVSSQAFILLALLAGLVLSLLLFRLPFGQADRLRDRPSRRFDERDIMFARARLQPGSENHAAYYAMRRNYLKGGREDQGRRIEKFRPRPAD